MQKSTKQIPHTHLIILYIKIKQFAIFFLKFCNLFCGGMLPLPVRDFTLAAACCRSRFAVLLLRRHAAAPGSRFYSCGQFAFMRACPTAPGAVPSSLSELVLGGMLPLPLRGFTFSAACCRSRFAILLLRSISFYARVPRLARQASFIVILFMLTFKSEL